MTPPKIAVLGGASPQPGEKTYQEAFDMGQFLALSGATVISGGYIGAMEAVSRGASEAGGHVIGFRCREVEEWKDVQPTPWAKELWPCETMLDLFLLLIRRSDAIVVLDGGVGTLVEVALTWNQLIIHAIEPKPFLLVGARWHHALQAFLHEFDDLIPSSYRQHLKFVTDPITALKQLQLELGF
jgi:hypothetical protein